MLSNRKRSIHQYVDRQLAGQSSSTPFMSIKDSHYIKKVTFDTQEGLEDKIDRLTMMSKLATNEEGGNARMYQRQNFRGQNYRGEYRGNYRNENYETGKCRSRERSYSDNNRRNDRSSSNSRSRSGSRVSINRDRIRCDRCRECDLFAEDFPTAREEGGTDQIKQMFNLDEDQTSLKTLVTDIYDNPNCISSVEVVRLKQLNL